MRISANRVIHGDIANTIVDAPRSRFYMIDTDGRCICAMVTRGCVVAASCRYGDSLYQSSSMILLSKFAKALVTTMKIATARRGICLKQIRV